MPVNLLSNTNGLNSKEIINSYPGKPITEIITNGFFTVDHKWTVIYWNTAAEKLLRVRAEDIVGKNLWEKFAGIIPIEFYSVYQKAFLGDIPIHFEEYWGEMGAWFDVITYHCDDILSVSFKTSKLPEKSEQGEKPLKILNELYRFVTEVTNDCLWEWDLQAKEIFWIDGGHKRVFGYPIENALVPQSFWENRLHPNDKEHILASLKKIIARGTTSVWEDEYRFQKSDGSYAHVHDRGHIIYDEDKKASRMIGATQNITEKVLLENKLIQERRARQKQLTAAVFTAQETERSHIGEELHDNLGQILAVANMYMQMAKTKGSNREKYIEKSCGLITNVIGEIRKISKNLVIPGTHIIGLYDNIENLIQDLSTVHTLKIEFHNYNIEEEDLDEKLQLTIYRIIQEQVNNILKHANATHAGIDIRRHEDKVVLFVCDNGEGCDILSVTKGVGIINIKSRAELYSGEVTIKTKPGKGFELKVELPLNTQTEKAELSTEKEQ